MTVSRWVWAVAVVSMWLPGADCAEASKATVFPQFAVGPGIETSLTVHNPLSEALSLRVELFRTQDLGGGEFFSTDVELEPRTTRLLEFRSEEAVSGWARLSSDSAFNSTGFVQLFSDGKLVGQVGVLPGEETSNFRIFGFRDPGKNVNTGIALVNPNSDADAHVEATQWSESGEEVGRTVFELKPGEHLARNINEPPFFEGTEQYQGTIEFETSVPVVPLTLRQDGLVTTSTPVAQAGSSQTTLSLDAPLFGTGGRTVGGPGICRRSPCDVLRLLTGPEEPLSKQGLDVCFTLRSRPENGCSQELRIERAPTATPTSRKISLGTEFEGSYCDADVNSISLAKAAGSPATCVSSIEWRVDSVQAP